MVRLRSIWSLAPLALAALLVGCGSSSSSSGSTAATSSSSSSATATTPTAPGTASTASTPTATSPTTSSTASTPTRSTGTTPAPPSTASSVSRCRQEVQVLPHLKASTRSHLEQLCGRANKNPEEMRKAAVEACREIVGASPLPAGAARERALRTCNHAGGSKSSGK